MPENSAELKCQAKKHLENLWATLDCTPITDDITTEYIFQKAGITQQIFENSMNLLSKKPTVILKREPQHCWINQYNSTLIKAWNANMDIQYVTDAYSCIKYILSYISKKESEESDLLKCAQREAREGNQDAVDELKRLGQTYLTHREIGIMESVWRALGLELKKCSRQIQWVATDQNYYR